MDVPEVIKIVLMIFGALATLGTSAGVVHHFASSVKSELRVVAAQLGTVGTQLTSLAADVKAAGIDVMRERQVEHARRLLVVEGEVVSLRARLHEIVNSHAGEQLRLVNAEHSLEKIEADVQVLKEDRR